jgi:hypothetical protein
MWVVGRSVGARCLFGAVGVRDGQVKMLARSGGNIAPGLAPISVEEYDDELSIMYFDLPHPPPNVAAQLKKVERLLKLPAAGHRAAGNRTFRCADVTRLAAIHIPST